MTEDRKMLEGATGEGVLAVRDVVDAVREALLGLLSGPEHPARIFHADPGH